jgi:methionyl-tRNA synthetase
MENPMTADAQPTDTPASDDRPLLVTSALPYANGSIHFGHVAGAYLPADIFVRYQRMRGADVLFVCGTDEHGVSITVKAEKEGTPYREYVARWHDEIRSVFDRFGISFDHFSRTSNEDPHYALSQEFFLRLLRSGAVSPHTTKQHFCAHCDRFLPDRYVEGTCYLCGGAARGDECKVCGSWLEAVKLKDPRCATCNNPPEIRETMQYELDLSPFSDPERLGREQPLFDRWLREAFRGDGQRLKPNVQKTVFDKLLVEGDGLHARDITRDLRWGVPLPERDLDGQPVEGHETKVLYVWFDAPIGYISATIEWARDVAGAPDAWKRYWITESTNDNSPAEGEAAQGARPWPGPRLVHFIGKDNIPFHCVVFPAMLGWQAEAGADDDFLGPGQGQRWVLPENVPANEFYNLEGGKFSTSDERTLDNDHMFERYGVDALRWYLTVSMPETADSQFRFSGLASHVNSDLADTIGNYASRVLKFVAARMDGRVPEPGADFEHGVPGLDGDMLRVVTVDRTREVCREFFGTGGEGPSFGQGAGGSTSGHRHSLGQRLERYEFRRAADALLDLARLGNIWFDSHAPWKSRKLEDPTECRTSLWCHVQILSALAVGMWPFIPSASDRLRDMLGLAPISAAISVPRGLEPAEQDLWCFQELEAGHTLGEPGILFQKIPDEFIAQDREELGG